MSVICYMSVICLVLGGVVRVRLYVIYAHLCNHILLSKWWGEPGAQLCTQLEVWVLGVGMSTLGAQMLCTPRVGGSKYRWSGAWRCLLRSHVLLDWSTLSLSGNKTHTITMTATTVNSLLVKCSLVNNGCSNQSDILDAFAIGGTSDGKFGGNLNYTNNIEKWVRISEGRYNNFIVTIVDQNNNEISILDNNLLINFLIRVK